jgi:hypothetical protein
MFALQQAESFFCGQLGDAGEIFDAEAIQNVTSF